MDDQKLGEEIEFAGVKMSKDNILYLMRDHATHHRAQAILFLRMNGIEAPNMLAGKTFFFELGNYDCVV